MSFKTWFSILGIVLGLVGGPVGKIIGLGLSLLVGGGLGRKNGAAIDNSPRYGFDNLQNPTRAGGPVPIVYGKDQVAPLVISVNLRQDADTQTLLLLCLVSEGEIEEISGVRLNDVAIESFPGASYETKLGTATQTAITDFNQIGVPYEGGTTLEVGSTHVHEMRAAADEIIFNLAFPGGIYQTDPDGKVNYSNGDIKVEWKQYGAADGTYAPWVGLVHGVTVGNPAGTITFAGNSQASLRRQIRLVLTGTSGIGRGRYTFRLTGQTGNETRKVRLSQVASVIEVNSDQRAYLNRAVLAIKCPASAQLQGGVPRVTCIVKGRKVLDPRTSTTAWSRNPALILRDLILNTRFGLGQWVESTDIDDGVGGTWRTAADACDALVTTPLGTTEARHECDLVVDAKAPARDWIDKIKVGMRATLFESGGLLKLVRLTSGAAVRTFSETEGDGVRKGMLASEDGSGTSSLVERAMDEAEKSNVVRMAYMDRDQGYQRKTLLVRDQRIAIGGVTGGPFAAGALLLGELADFTTTKGICTRAAANGDTYLYYIQEEGVAPWGGIGGLLIYTQNAPSVATVQAGAPAYISPERALEVLLMGVTRKTQALRESRHHLALAQLCTKWISFDLFFGDLDLEPGDHVAVTSSRLGYSAKQFTVHSIAIRPDGRASIDAREYNAGVFIDSIDPVPNPPSFQPGGQVTPGLRPTTPAPESGTAPVGIISPVAATGTAPSTPGPVGSATDELKVTVKESGYSNWPFA